MRCLSDVLFVFPLAHRVARIDSKADPQVTRVAGAVGTLTQFSLVWGVSRSSTAPTPLSLSHTLFHSQTHARRQSLSFLLLSLSSLE